MINPIIFPINLATFSAHEFMCKWAIFTAYIQLRIQNDRKKSEIYFWF
jgi:hypothetical protein